MRSPTVQTGVPGVAVVLYTPGTRFVIQSLDGGERIDLNDPARVEEFARLYRDLFDFAKHTNKEPNRA